MKGKRKAYEELYGSSVPPLKPRVESSIRSLSLRVYLHEGDDDYDACCQVFLYGGRALMHSIVGSGFYLAWEQIVEHLARCGATVIEGYVVPSHARLLQMVARQRGAEVTVEDAEDAFGRKMHWVRVPTGVQVPKVTL